MKKLKTKLQIKLIPTKQLEQKYQQQYQRLLQRILTIPEESRLRYMNGILKKDDSFQTLFILSRILFHGYK